MDRQRWRIADLIDLEFFMDRDEGEDLEHLTSRDREIFASLPAGVMDQATPASLIRAWLAARRRSFAAGSSEEELPGRIWHELYLLFFWGVLVIGLVSGAALAFSFLSYSGTRPVNVSAYFGIFVLVEALLFAGLLLVSAFSRLLGRQVGGFFLYRLLRRFFATALAGILDKTVSRTSTDKRLRWEARRNMVRNLQQRYGALFTRPFFLLAQLLGVAFNTGILAATLLKVITSDVAFGWQTTLDVGTDTVHTLVRLISLPWSWLGQGCCPTAEQIEGSRLILKDGIYHLATPDLTSWWPFLCMAVLVYGLLPRLLVLLLTFVSQRRDLADLRFDQGRYRQLLHRMRTPVLSTRARTERVEEQEQKCKESPSAPAGSAGKQETAGKEPEPGNRAETAVRPEPEEQLPSPATVLGLVPEEIFQDLEPEQLSRVVEERLGYRVGGLEPVFTLEQSEEDELVRISSAMEERGCEDLFLLQEAWQPPIQELLSFLADLRRSVGQGPTMIIGLIGKPGPDTVLTPVKPLNLQIWQQKTATLADDGLQLVELVK